MRVIKIKEHQHHPYARWEIDDVGEFPCLLVAWLVFHESWDGAGTPVFTRNRSELKTLIVQNFKIREIEHGAFDQF